MELLKTNETSREDSQGKPKGPSKIIHVMPSKSPAQPAAMAETGQPATPVAEKTAPPASEDPAPLSGANPAPPAGKKPFQFVRGISLGKRLSAFEKAARNAPRLKIPLKYRLLPDKGLARRAAWDISAILSLLVNAVLLAVIVILAVQVSNLKSTVNGLLGGLYDNFVRMDNSVISTTITVNQMPIPIDFILPVSQPSINVTLTQDVTIRGARVVINTGAMSINSSATVTLPAGTTLPVSLYMEIPVKTTVLLDLALPVNIKLAEANFPDPNIANLHAAFVGLQNTVGPFYCLLQPGAQNYAGSYICQQGIYVPKSTNP
jgi:hypothetical protein